MTFECLFQAKRSNVFIDFYARDGWTTFWKGVCDRGICPKLKAFCSYPEGMFLRGIWSAIELLKLLLVLSLIGYSSAGH